MQNFALFCFVFFLFFFGCCLIIKLFVIFVCQCFDLTQILDVWDNLQDSLSRFQTKHEYFLLEAEIMKKMANNSNGGLTKLNLTKKDSYLL